MSDVLTNLSDDLANLVKATDPSIVRVEARRRLPATGIVWSSDGLIVTAHHVIDRKIDPKHIGIGLGDGNSTTAELIGRDPTTDIAVLRANAGDFSPAEWGTLDEIQVGHLVLALGRPGEKVMATLGVISAVEGGWRTRAGGQIDHYLQTDVLMYPGFSGGPLVGADGKILGLNTSGLARGVSLALTKPTIERVLGALMQHGRIRRGYLGVGVQTVDLPAATAEQEGQTSGVLVVSVEPDSPADQAGLVLGDTLISLDGQPVREVEELLGALIGDRVGNEVTLKVLRAGELKELTVTIGERE